MYDESPAGWRSLSLQVMNQAGVVTEKVWFNFVPDKAHWADYAGRARYRTILTQARQDQDKGGE